MRPADDDQARTDAHPEQPFRERTGRQVLPGERRIKFREAVRVIVRTPDARVLVFNDTDPGVPGSQWWVTPGGGIDPGESELQAAARELYEETGYQAQVTEFGGPVLERVVIHGYSDQVLVQHEQFFVVSADEFDVVTDGFTELEQRTLKGSRWATADELGGQPVWPEQLPSLIGELGTDPLPAVRNLGTVEESTIPVTWVERRMIDDQLLAGFPAGTVLTPAADDGPDQLD